MPARAAVKRLTEAEFDALFDAIVRRLHLLPPRAPKHLTQEALSERLDVPVETLKDWRRDGRGPDYLKGDGGSNATVRYPLAWVEEWELSRRQRMASAS